MKVALNTINPKPFCLITDVDDRGDSIQYEVLHQTESGMYLITQPVGSTPISLSGMAMGTDHIIVHTLPVSYYNYTTSGQYTYIT